jgi:hypothetical protein
MSHIMGGLAHIPKVLERRSTPRARSNRYTMGNTFSGMHLWNIHPSLTETKR